ncbi:ABC transporter permease [Paenibacillus tuaregi]|uniref:ABC transporter permease n=1 Tax=Paenibacillus tuaregi TaxID=1816681 RepID=UPI000839691C|nr:ABC transporter permease [Paenibacillus tuaregi]
MSNWKSAYVNELVLMMYRKKVVIIAVFSAILPVLAALLMRSLQPLLGLFAVSSSFPVEMLGLFTSVWLPLVMLTLTADLFPQEVSGRTLKLILIRPVTRLQVFLGKVAALATVIGALLVISGLVSYLCMAAAGTSAGFSEVLLTAKAYLAGYGAMLAILTLFVFVAQFFKSVSGYILVMISLYAAIKLAPFLNSSIAAFSPASYTGWHLLWLSPYVSGSRLLTGALFLTASCVLFLSLGYYKFDRKDL